MLFSVVLVSAESSIQEKVLYGRDTVSVARSSLCTAYTEAHVVRIYDSVESRFFILLSYRAVITLH
jgi:hypothetical protein